MTSEELRAHLWIMCIYLKAIKKDPASATGGVTEFLRNSDDVPFVIYCLFFRRVRELLEDAGMLTPDMRSTLERMGEARGPATAEALQRQLAREDKELAELARLTTSRAQLMTNRKGFNAEVVSRHRHLMPGTVVHMTPCSWWRGEPSLYKIQDRQTGQTQFYIDGNLFRNRFRRINENPIR